MAVPTLKQISTDLAVKNVKQIDDLGEMPWDLCRPIIEAVTSAEHLLALQERSPHIVEHTGFKWQQLLRRDFPSWARNPIQPAAERNWSRVYRKVKRDYEEGLRKDQEELIRARAEAEASKIDDKPVFVPIIIPGPDGTETSRRKTFIAYGGTTKLPQTAAMSTFVKAVRKDRAGRTMDKTKIMGRQHVSHPPTPSQGPVVNFNNNNAIFAAVCRKRTINRPSYQMTNMSNKQARIQAAKLATDYSIKHKEEIDQARQRERVAVFDRVVASASKSPSSSGSGDERSRLAQGIIHPPASRSASSTPSTTSSNASQVNKRPNSSLSKQRFPQTGSATKVGATAAGPSKAKPAKNALTSGLFSQRRSPPSITQQVQPAKATPPKDSLPQARVPLPEGTRRITVTPPAYTPPPSVLRLSAPSQLVAMKPAISPATINGTRPLYPTHTAPVIGERVSSIIEVIGKDGKRKLERAPANAFAPRKRIRRE